MTEQTNPAEQDTWLTDAKGRRVPINTVSEMDLLKDDVINRIVAFAMPLSDEIARFKGHTFDDVYTFVDLVKEKYGATVGGKKGNIELVSYNGCAKVQISIADHVAFGPELQVAKVLIDECIAEWSDGTRDELRALVTHAFETDKPGQVNREGLFSLRRLDIKDPKWKRAMDAISDSMRVIGSKAYVRVYQRPSAEAGWEMIPLNIAAV
jgi:hypothetical protein